MEAYKHTHSLIIQYNGIDSEHEIKLKLQTARNQYRDLDRFRRYHVFVPPPPKTILLRQYC